MEGGIRGATGSMVGWAAGSEGAGKSIGAVVHPGWGRQEVKKSLVKVVE